MRSMDSAEGNNEGSLKSGRSSNSLNSSTGPHQQQQGASAASIDLERTSSHEGHACAPNGREQHYAQLHSLLTSCCNDGVGRCGCVGVKCAAPVWRSLYCAGLWIVSIKECLTRGSPAMQPRLQPLHASLVDDIYTRLIA